MVAAQTTVPLRWVSDRLKMGHYTRVTQALSRMERHPARKLKHLRQRLERALPSWPGWETVFELAPPEHPSVGKPKRKQASRTPNAAAKFGSPLTV